MRGGDPTTLQNVTIADETHESTASRILDGALRAAENHGVRKLTMDDIAGAAGLARITLYSHYRSKDALVAAVVSREQQRFFAHLEAVGSQYADLDDRLVETFAVGVRAMRQHALLQRMLRSEPAAILPHMMFGSPLLDIARQWIARQLADPAGEPGLALQSVAELSVRLAQSLILSEPSVHNLDDADEIRDIARRWILPALHSAIDAR